MLDHKGRAADIYPVALRAIFATVPGDELNLSKIDQTNIQHLSKLNDKSVPKALLEGSWKLWEAIGRLLEDSWRALKGVSGLSCPREATTLPKGTTVKIKTRALGRL